MRMMPLHLHVNQKSDYDDDDELTLQWITKMIAASSSTGLYSKGASQLFVGSFYRTPSEDDPEVNNRLHDSVFKLTSKDTALPNTILMVISTHRISTGKTYQRARIQITPRL